MRIGIMTFWETQDNYGQLLQASALQFYLEAHGHEPFLIKYDKSHSVKQHKPGKIQKLKQINWAKLFDLKAVMGKVNSATKTVSSAPTRHFDDFKEDFIKFHPRMYNSPAELRDNPPPADVYITGSDQVWNYRYIGDCGPFFLQFGPPHVKRMSYAASIGHRELPPHILLEYKQYLKTMDAISVRESSGAALCREMGYDALLVPDPTMLIPKEKWIEYSVEVPEFHNAGNKKKVLIYTIGNRSSDVKEQLITYIKQSPGMEIAHVSINKDYEGDKFPSIPEWLGYYKDADLVITNSYHGMIFSVLFNNSFIAIPSSGDKVGMNERLLTLMEKMDLEDHILYEFDPQKIEELMDKSVNWDAVNEKIAAWREVAGEFLDLNGLFAEAQEPKVVYAND